MLEGFANFHRLCIINLGIKNLTKRSSITIQECDLNNMLHNTNKVDFAILLAGGKSSRMQSDKALLEIAGSTLLGFQKDRLASVADNIIISRNDGNKSHVQDTVAQYGPLAGIHACLKHIKNTSMKLSADIIIMPIDMPMVSKALLDNLTQYGQMHHKVCYYENNFLPIYLPNVDHALQVLDDMIQNEQRLLNTFLEKMDAEDLECMDAESLANANTPMQWKVMLKKLGK